MDVITDQNAAAPGTVKIAEVIAGGPADGLVLISPLKTKTPSKDLSKPDADCDVASPKDAWMKRRFGRRLSHHGCMEDPFMPYYEHQLRATKSMQLEQVSEEPAAANSS